MLDFPFWKTNNWLVVDLPLLKNIVSWEYDIPNIVYGKNQKMSQTTNQIIFSTSHIIPCPRFPNAPSHVFSVESFAATHGEFDRLPSFANIDFQWKCLTYFQFK